MTNGELLMLQRGRIPAELITPHIQKYLDAEGEADDSARANPNEPGPLRWLSERADVRPNTVYAYLAGKRQSMDFNTADRLLIAVGRVDLWRGELVEYYERVNLAYQAHVPTDVARSENTCRNGHERTPENTKMRSDGRTECRVCSRASASRTYYRRVTAQKAACLARAHRPAWQETESHA